MSYDPTYAHEVAVIIQDGLRRMFTEQEDVFYYITLMNENYRHPGAAARTGVTRWWKGSSRGCTCCVPPGGERARVQLLGTGTILREVEAAAELLAAEWGVSADIWSCPSFTELARDGQDVERWNMLHPAEPQRISWVDERLGERPAGPVVAATDYMRAYADQIRAYVPADRRYAVLGTDGFGRSDYRRNLRAHFEVDRHHVLLAALSALAAEGAVPADSAAQAIKRYGIATDKPNPRTPERRRARYTMTTTANNVEVPVPDIGDFSDIPVIEVMVSVGDKVNADDPVITLESDKATMDVPAPIAGTVTEVRVAVGDHVSKDSVDPAHRPRRGAVTSPPSLVEQQEPAPATPVTTPAGPPVAARPGRPGQRGARGCARRAVGAADGPRAGRRPRRRHGDGPKGRITKDDLLSFLKGPAEPAAAATAPAAGAGIPEVPAQDYAAFGPVERVELSRIKRLSGPYLHRSWLNVPHVTQHDEADITALDAYRRELDTAAKAERDPYRVTLLAFLVKAAVSALKQFPEFNSSLAPEKDALVLKGYYNIGIAVDTPGGLRRAGREGRRPQGHRGALPRVRGISARARDGQAQPRPTCRAARSRSPASAASAAPGSPRSSTRPRSRSWAWCARR